MAEIFDPKITVGKKPNIWQKHGFKIVLIFTLIILLISGYLIYIYYLSPSYELYQLLPKSYTISFELTTDRFTFPKAQQKYLLENEFLRQVYNETTYEIQKHLQTLPPDTQNVLKSFKHLIFFIADSDKFGFIGKIPDEKTRKLLADIGFTGWQTQVIKNQIFAASNNQSLLDEMVSQKLASGPLPYFSFTVSPWLKVTIQNEFFNQQYSSKTLNSLQQILLPLSFAGGNYSLELNSGFKFLELLLTPSAMNNNLESPTLNDWLVYLPDEENTIFGLADTEDLTKNIDKNANLQAIFRQFDSYFWLNYQISLSNLLKNINGPVLIGIGKDNWRIITKSDNIQLAEYYIRQYFGQFKPKTQEITLPDGSIGTQLMNNPSSVEFIEQENNGWQIKVVADSPKNIGFAQNNNILLIGNNMNTLLLRQGKIECIDEQISMIFSVNPSDSKLIPLDKLIDFTKIIMIELNSGQIKSCFNFK